MPSRRQGTDLHDSGTPPGRVLQPGLVPSPEENINKVERVQRVAARFVTRRPNRRSAPDSVTALVTSLGWDTLETRRHKASHLTIQNGGRPCSYPGDLSPGSQTPSTNTTIQHPEVLPQTSWRKCLQICIHPAYHTTVEPALRQHRDIAYCKLLQADAGRCPTAPDVTAPSQVFSQHCTYMDTAFYHEQPAPSYALM